MRRSNRGHWKEVCGVCRRAGVSECVRRKLLLRSGRGLHRSRLSGPGPQVAGCALISPKVTSQECSGTRSLALHSPPAPVTQFVTCALRGRIPPPKWMPMSDSRSGDDPANTHTASEQDANAPSGFVLGLSGYRKVDPRVCFKIQFLKVPQ